MYRGIGKRGREGEGGDEGGREREGEEGRRRERERAKFGQYINT